jgi:hypothetical protein
MRASRPGDTFLASLVVMSRSMWAGVCLSGRGDSDAEADAVGRAGGGDFAGRTTTTSLGSGAGLLLLVVVLLLLLVVLESVVDGASLI